MVKTSLRSTFSQPTKQLTLLDAIELPVTAEDHAPWLVVQDNKAFVRSGHNYLCFDVTKKALDWKVCEEYPASGHLHLLDEILVSQRQQSLIGVEPSTGSLRWQINHPSSYAFDGPGLYHQGVIYFRVQQGIWGICPRTGNVLHKMKTARFHNSRWTYGTTANMSVHNGFLYTHTRNRKQSCFLESFDLTTHQRTTKPIPVEWTADTDYYAGGILLGDTFYCLSSCFVEKQPADNNALCAFDLEKHSYWYEPIQPLDWSSNIT